MHDNLSPPPLVPTTARPMAAAGWAIAVFSTFCFSLGPLLAKVVYATGLDATTMLFIRFCFTIVLLGATLGLTMPQRLRMRRRELTLTFMAGLGAGVSMLFFFWSLTRLEASIGSMIFSLHPLAVLGLLAVRGEKFTPRHGVRAALGLLGVYLLIGPGGNIDMLGVGMMLVSVVTSSFQSAFIQWFLQEQDGIAVTLYMVIGINVIVGGRWLMEGANTVVPNVAAWAGIVGLAVVSTYLARVSWFAAIRRLGSGQVSMLAPLETLMTVIWSMLILGERLSLIQAVGGGLIFLSALLASNRLLYLCWPKRTPATADASRRHD